MEEGRKGGKREGEGRKERQRKDEGGKEGAEGVREEEREEVGRETDDREGL